MIVLPRVQAVFIISTATVGYRTGAFPRWLALVGFLFGLGMFLLPMLVGPAMLIFPVWVGVMSAALLVRRKHVQPRAASEA